MFALCFLCLLDYLGSRSSFPIQSGLLGDEIFENGLEFSYAALDMYRNTGRHVN